MSDSQYPPVNTLLRAMSLADFGLLQPYMTRVPFERDFELAAANMPVEHIYFPEDGVGSVVLDPAGVGATEIGIFGIEGMSSVHTLLGADSSPNRTMVQIGGRSALRIALSQLRAASQDSASLRELLLRYAQTMMMQISNTAAANAHHRMEARLARWLLMCHDRMDGDELRLTHEFMAMMIAVHRSGVTVTLHILEGGGSIRSKRGRVVILDRERLEELAGDSYGAPEAEYRKLIGPLVSDRAGTELH